MHKTEHFTPHPLPIQEPLKHIAQRHSLFTRCMWHHSGKNVLQWVIPEKIHTSLTEEVSAIQGGEDEKCLKMSIKKGRYAYASLSKGLHFVKSY